MNDAKDMKEKDEKGKMEKVKSMDMENVGVGVGNVG